MFGWKSRDFSTLYLFLFKENFSAPATSLSFLPLPSQISRISYHFLSPLLLLITFFFSASSFIISRAQFATLLSSTQRHHGTLFQSSLHACMLFPWCKCCCWIIAIFAFVWLHDHYLVYYFIHCMQLQYKWCYQRTLSVFMLLGNCVHNRYLAGGSH